MGSSEQQPSAEWQLLSAVQSIFTFQPPSIAVPEQARQAAEVLKNLDSIFKFETWLLPDALQEARTYNSLSDTSKEGPSALKSLLDIFERYVDEMVLSFVDDGISKLRFPRLQAYPKLRALDHELRELNQRKMKYTSFASDLSDSARDLVELVWVGVTLDGYHEIIACLEQFNRMIDHAPSDVLDGPLINSAEPWNETELQCLWEASDLCKNMLRLFQGLTEALKECNGSHLAMVHLSGFQKVNMLISSCSRKAPWCRAECSFPAGGSGPLIRENPGISKRMDNLCATLREYRHTLLHIVCDQFEVSLGSEKSIHHTKSSPDVTLADLLQERALTNSGSLMAPVLSKRTKKIIAAVVANSLLTLLGTPWLQERPAADKIYFSQDTNTREIVDIQIPYIACQLPSERMDLSDEDRPERYLEFIYAFGVLLLELELDQTISILPGDEEESDEASPPIYMTFLRVFQLRKEDIDDPYLNQVIDSCLTFNSKIEAAKHPSFGEDLAVRAAVLRYIVQPLIQRLEAAYPGVSLDLFPKLSPPAMTGSPRPLSQEDRPSKRVFRRAIEGPSFQRSQSTPSSSTISQSDKASPLIRIANTRTQPPRDRKEYKVAIICALTLEADAVKCLFDAHWDFTGISGSKASGDTNAYSTGRIGQHNVVLVHMPNMGKEPAAIAATYCRSSFPGVMLALVVGICGGVPFYGQGKEIILGDVVVSEGIVPYDFGRKLPDSFVRKVGVLDSYGRPNMTIRSLFAKLKGRWDHERLRDKVAGNMLASQDSFGKAAQYPGADKDKLFDPGYRHKHQILPECRVCSVCAAPTDPVCEAALTLSCEQLQCHDGKLVSRKRLQDEQDEMIHRPDVHFGLIASGSTVMKSGEDRNRIAEQESVIAFEMEGAGAWDVFPSLMIIKGVCDYADSHKSKEWQDYAATTAAACMKAILEYWDTDGTLR